MYYWASDKSGQWKKAHAVRKGSRLSLCHIAPHDGWEYAPSKPRCLTCAAILEELDKDST